MMEGSPLVQSPSNRSAAEKSEHSEEEPVEQKHGADEPREGPPTPGAAATPNARRNDRNLSESRGPKAHKMWCEKRGRSVNRNDDLSTIGCCTAKSCG
jgi:hypothetical protein